MRALLLTARPGISANLRLLRAAADAGLELLEIDATRVMAQTGAGDALWYQEIDLLQPPPGVFLARVGNWRPESILAVAEVAETAGIATPNPAAAIATARDHWRTLKRLSGAGIAVPQTLAGADPEELARAADRHLGFPVVVKQRRSRMGVGVILCSGRDHLESVLDSLWRVGDEVLVQEYLECAGRSLRVLVAGGRVVAAARFTAAPGEWRSNAARGGAAEPYPVSEAESRMAVEAAQVVGLGLCGVDLLPGSGATVVGEVNPTPGFEALERASGVQVAKALVSYLANLAARS